MFKNSVRLVLFKEHPVTDFSISQPQQYEIYACREDMVPSFISNGKFNNKQYCTCLLLKLFQLKKTEVKSFLQYQCDKISDSLFWLHKLEKLIDMHRDVFTSENDKRHIEKVLSVIEIIRDRIETKETQIKEKTFDFCDVKKKIKTYNFPSEKISYLLEAKTEYLQNKPHLVDPTAVPFDEKIQLEIELINSQVSLKESATSSLKIDSKNGIKNKAKINCNLNQFVNVFFQLMHEQKIDNKPLLESDNNTIAEILSSNFLDKSGNEISAETVRTILKPSRIEKRPKGNSRIVFKL